MVILKGNVEKKPQRIEALGLFWGGLGGVLRDLAEFQFFGAAVPSQPSETADGFIHKPAFERIDAQDFHGLKEDPIGFGAGAGLR